MKKSQLLVKGDYSWMQCHQRNHITLPECVQVPSPEGCPGHGMDHIHWMVLPQESESRSQDPHRE